MRVTVVDFVDFKLERGLVLIFLTHLARKVGIAVFADMLKPEGPVNGKEAFFRATCRFRGWRLQSLKLIRM